MHGWLVHDSVVLQPEYSLYHRSSLVTHERWCRPKRTDHSSGSNRKMFVASADSADVLQLIWSWIIRSWTMWSSAFATNHTFIKHPSQLHTQRSFAVFRRNAGLCYAVELYSSEWKQSIGLSGPALHCIKLLLLIGGTGSAEHLALCHIISSTILRNRKGVIGIGYTNDRNLWNS